MREFTLLVIALLAISGVHSKKFGCGGCYRSSACPSHCDGGYAGGYGVANSRVVAAAPVAAPVVRAGSYAVATGPAVPGPAAAVATTCVNPIVPSRWSAYDAWSPCSSHCGPGTMHRTRRCISGGACSKPCVGPSRITKVCGLPIVHSRWTKFGPYGPCSVKCGRGIRVRKRVCIKGNICGDPCRGEDSETKECNIPVRHARWSHFSHWSSCSVSCGIGFMTRRRKCQPGNLCGKPCVGPVIEKRTCGKAISLDQDCGARLVAHVIPRPVAVVAKPVARVVARPVARVAAPVARVATRVAAVAAPAARVVSAGGCTDIRGECGYWAGQGYCGGQYRPRLIKDCCNSCRAAATYRTVAARCGDASRTCRTYAGAGYCTNSSYRYYMKDNCCRSCRGRLGGYRFKSGGGKLRYSPQEYVEMMDEELKKRKKK